MFDADHIARACCRHLCGPLRPRAGGRGDADVAPPAATPLSHQDPGPSSLSSTSYVVRLNHSPTFLSFHLSLHNQLPRSPRLFFPLCYVHCHGHRSPTLTNHFRHGLRLATLRRQSPLSTFFDDVDSWHGSLTANVRPLPSRPTINQTHKPTASAPRRP